MTKVAVLEIEGCMASSAAITYDVMATANRIGATKRVPTFKVTTVRCGSRRSSADLRGIELVIVPGLGTATAEALDAKLKGPACRHAADMLRRAHGRGAMLAASCASTFLLAETGLLDGRRATTTWWFAPLFRQRYPAVELLTEQMVVADWPIATGAAAMAQMDLMLAVVGRFAGPSLAKACANYLLLDGRRSQAPFMAINYLASQDPRMAKAEKWVRDNIARDFLRSRNWPRPSRWRHGHLHGASRRPAASRRYSSCNGSGWRPRDCCLRPRASRSMRSHGGSDMRSPPRFAG
jgi:transcriptional regulator GlxA family with amidase domain